MERQTLVNILQQPETIGHQETALLENVIKSYPYCQAFHALHLKGLKLKESFKYNSALKITAAHTTDRSVLFDYITSTHFNQNNISALIKKNSASVKDIAVNDADDISVNRSVTIDDALKDHVKATEGVLDPHLFKAKPSSQESETSKDRKDDAFIDIDVKNITPEQQLHIGKPLEFDENESHSFIEWLKITSFKPIDRSIEPTDTGTKPKKQTSKTLNDKLDIIDKFITENPKIKPSRTQAPKPNLVNNDAHLSEHLMTETLARIYLEQKNYDQAIQSYKILSLKYPEKSSFFADQIKAVEELKDQNNIK